MSRRLAKIVALGGEEGAEPLEEYAEPEDDIDEEDTQERANTLLRTRGVLSILNDEQRTVICQHFGLEGEKARPNKKIAAGLGMTTQNAQRICSEALQQLKMELTLPPQAVDAGIERRKRYNDAIMQLEERERFVVNASLGLNGVKKRSLRLISEQLKVTMGVARGIKRDALRKIISLCEENGAAPDEHHQDSAG